MGLRVLGLILCIMLSWVSNITLLREVLLSILAGNIKGKKRTRKAMEIHHAQPILKRLNLTYISEHLTWYARDFRIYHFIYYRIFPLYYVVYLGIAVIVFCYASEEVSMRILIANIVLEGICFLLIMIIARYGPDHRTKYDRV